MKILEKLKPEGMLLVRTGTAKGLIYGENGEIINWHFEPESCKAFKNQICYTGWEFVNSKGWDNLGLCIALGTGSTSDGNTPKTTDTKLNNELSSARFIIPSAKGRVRNNTIMLSTLWNRGQGYTGQITEWGLFANLLGNNLQTPNTGYLVSRIAQTYTRTATDDVELTWVISYS